MRGHYAETAERYSALAGLAGRKLFATSMLRLACFAGGAVLIWAGFAHSVWWGVSAAAVVLLLFALLLRRYLRLAERQVYYGNLAEINRHEAGAMSGNRGFADGGGRYVDTGHSFSYDIDLFGNASLFRYINRTVTGFGRDLLARWMSNPYALSGDMENRQAAVRELAGKERWRHEFMAAGYNRHVEREDIAGLNVWIDSVENQNRHVLHQYLPAVLPAATFLSLLMAVAGMAFGYHLFSLLFFVNILYVFTRLRHTNAIHSAVTKKYNCLVSINKMLKVFEAEDFESAILQNIKNNMSGGGVSAAVSVRKLGRLVNSFDYRLNMIVGTVLNGFVLWDIQCIRRLEKWKTEYRAYFAAWLDMLGQIDAYISLGNFAANNQSYVYPSVSAGDVFLSSVHLGHPLIDERAMVRNSFEIPHRGMAIIVTGANMSGKSTFLRTLAVNYILAMAGAPVCADRFVFRPVELFTSMRAEDSLADNESYFYAELKRLKQLKLLVESGSPVFFILDEILKGTNSTDKSLGAKMFLTKLIELGGTGLIATHDISLGEMELLFPDKAVNKCFEIEIDEGKISFDYVLRPGITTKMNAALLMKQMGIVE
jgi:hypothetical protein